MGRIARTAATLIHGFSRVLAVISAVGMAFVLLIVSYNVVLRTSGQPEIRGLIEYSEIGLALAVFFALGETERRRGHVSVQLLLGRLKGRSYAVLRVAAGVFAAFIAVLLAWASWEVLSDSIARGEYKLGLVRLPMWPARLAVFCGFLALALEQILTAIEDALHKPDKQEALESQAL